MTGDASAAAKGRNPGGGGIVGEGETKGDEIGNPCTG